MVSAASYTIDLQITTSFGGATTLSTDGALRVTLWLECSHIGKSRSISSSSLWSALPLTLSVYRLRLLLTMRQQ